MKNTKYKKPNKKQIAELDQLALEEHLEWDTNGKYGKNSENTQAVSPDYWQKIMGAAHSKQITMRLPEELLNDVKALAKSSNYSSYQKYIKTVLMKAVADYNAKKSA